jgi:DNA-binding PadR family transcriptional regulator
MSASRANKPPSRRGRAAAARRAAAETTKAAEGPLAAADAFQPAGRPSDVFGGELPLRGVEAAGGGPRRRDIFTLLVLHLIDASPESASYGNQLIEQIDKLTHGAVVLNPNTMYPLLRELETRSLIEGRWEHPEKRSRRLYTITAAGRREYQRLRAGLEPFLDSIVQSITLIQREVYGTGRRTRTGSRR